MSLFQSTLLQEERPFTHFCTHIPYTISIHAPTRGATPKGSGESDPGEISIHAPTRGATSHGDDPCGHFRNFNPRSYKRSDVSIAFIIPAVYLFQSTLLQEERRISVATANGISPFSIHAPTRGATRHLHNVPASPVYFNPRSYKRSDRDKVEDMIGIGDFNPRSYKRSDKVGYASENEPSDFNPRSYKRSDGVKHLERVHILLISIHAPTRGATASPCAITSSTENFNPRSYKRSDTKLQCNVTLFAYFNPRSYKRSDTGGK